MKKSIDSNSTGLAFAEEKSLKNLPTVATDAADPTWYGLEPNSYPDFGADYKQVARQPITNTRQQAKGSIVDLDVKGGFNSDLTQRNLLRLMQGFFFADAHEKPSTAPVRRRQIGDPVTDVAAFNVAAIVISDVDADSYNAAAGLGIFQAGHLCYAKKSTKTNNNGLFHVTAVGGTALTTDKVLTVEAGPTPIELEAVGFQFAAGDLALTIVGATVVLTSAAPIDFTTLALVPGEWIFVGGDGAGLRYATAGSFFGRIKTINATNLVLDLTTGTPVADAGALKTIQIFFGKTINNATTAAAIIRRSYQLERQLGSDDVGTQSEILIGAIPNEMTVNLQQASKATVDLAFVACDATQRTGTDGLKAGARVAAPKEAAYNTSHDIIAMRLAVIDGTLNPTALFAYATEAKIVINNQVTPNKALAVLGAFEANAGNFEVSGTSNAYFASVAAAAAIRNNSDVCLTAILGRANAGMIFDLPLLSLGGGLPKVEKDKPIMVDLTQSAAENPLGYTAMFNFFEYLPTVAMPA